MDIKSINAAKDKFFGFIANGVDVMGIKIRHEKVEARDSKILETVSLDFPGDVEEGIFRAGKFLLDLVPSKASSTPLNN